MNLQVERTESLADWISALGTSVKGWCLTSGGLFCSSTQ